MLALTYWRPDIVIEQGFPLGSVVLATAAVLAAAVAALTAVKLNRDELEHDRDMRDRDELRKTIDDCYQSIVGATDTFFELWAKLAEWDEIDGTERGEFERQVADPHRVTWALPPDFARLRLRLREGHPILVAHDRVTLTLLAWGERLKEAPRPPADEDQESIKAAQETAADALGSFINACRGWLLTERR